MELDDLAQSAVHIWLEDDEGIQAYLRVMDRGMESEHVYIGRVIAVKRRCGIGGRILEEGVKTAKEIFTDCTFFLKISIILLLNDIIQNAKTKLVYNKPVFAIYVGVVT